jgi:hypothetical protein
MKVSKMLLATIALFLMFLTGCNSAETSSSDSKQLGSGQKKSSEPASTTNPADGAKRITINEAKAAWEKDNSSVVFVDTRTKEAYKSSRIKGAYFYGEFQPVADKLPKDKMIVAYCT